MGKSQVRRLRQMSLNFKKQNSIFYYRLSYACSQIAQSIRSENKN